MMQGIALIVFFIALLILEFIFPLRRQRHRRRQRLITNAGLSLALLMTVFLIARPIHLHLLDWGQTRAMGLNYFLPDIIWFKSIVTFLCLDLSYYYWHRLNHEWAFLWRFHVIHHIDLDLDVTTSLRFHFMEVVFTIGFRLLQILIIGVSLPVYLAYEFYFQLATYFHHSNLRLAKPFERGLNYFLVTPRMHGIHHSAVMDETNRNYGVILSIWDRLHRSLRLDIPQRKLQIGLAAYSDEQDNQLKTLFLQPFQKQKNAFKSGDKRFYTRIE